MTTSSDAPLVVFPFGEPDPRLEDYLDDKLQSTADLDTLDALLQGVNLQHDQLQTQLDDAARALEDARGAAASQRNALQVALAEFDGLEDDITRRLAVANAENAAPEAVVQRLTGPMEHLQRVTLAHDYLVLLQDVGRLADAARAALPDRPKDALAPYTRLRRLATRLVELQGAAADTGAPAAHLVAHVGSVADGLWAEMNATMRSDFAALLEKRGWPSGVDAAVPADETWRDGFGKLVDLQVPEILEREPLPLLPIDVMAQIFIKEFRYHFLTDGRRTSEPRQFGDVCCPWFLERVETWSDFLRASFADLLADRFEGTGAGDKMAYVDPVCALVASLLPVMREKVQQTVVYAVAQLHQQRQQLEQQQGADIAGSAPVLTTPTFLGNLIVQLLAFDEELRTRFGYDGGLGSSSASSARYWPGLAGGPGGVLDLHFSLWLQAEKEYALSRYREIVDGTSQAALDARATIDYDYSGAGRTKPTLAAVHVVDLLRAVTGQYRYLRKFHHRLRFLIDIQITLLDAYDERLRGSLETYASMTSAVGRTLHGVTKEQLATLEGTGGLEALCRVFGSADHLINTLREWANEEFFVTLYNELETRSKKAEQAERAGGTGQLGGGLSVSNVRDRTASSAAVNGGAHKNHGDGNMDEDNLFDGTIQAFKQRRKAAQDFLVSTLANSHRKAFRPYVLRTQWTTVAGNGRGSIDDSSDASATVSGAGAVISPADLAITPELDEPLRIIRRNLEFLARALGTVPLRRVVRGAFEKLQDHLWGDVLMANKFTTLGAAQFARDISAVVSTVERQVPLGSTALEGLREGVALLNLPVSVPADASSDDRASITLQQANDRMFVDNTEAKKLLQELQLTTLTPSTGRNIIQRRIESSG
ncbi:hypothetical protein SPBR_06608 [Sporothrix brasiliensis 5110]|uniref:RINT-1 family protein n=1 Tax=Sporothrix brasiliensis 5110 TaxID=1398154 RepID=A0A0C2IVJ9_9PEZI|nr:uncharacterized protein SPBR_06608 [Sporothrix brasiliensis 5110]KIH89022.1 hypothetical protein SPBR_06608 [Sporothrix brasiliensis 5110]